MENPHQKVPTVKYTEEQEEEMKALYLAEDTQEGREAVVQELHERWKKPIKSIIAKMSKSNYYIRKENISKLTGAKPETKEQLVRRIATYLGRQEFEVEGLEKAPKKVLLMLLGEYKK